MPIFPVQIPTVAGKFTAIPKGDREGYSRTLNRFIEAVNAALEAVTRRRDGFNRRVVLRYLNALITAAQAILDGFACKYIDEPDALGAESCTHRNTIAGALYEVEAFSLFTIHDIPLREICALITADLSDIVSSRITVHPRFAGQKPKYGPYTIPAYVDGEESVIRSLAYTLGAETIRGIRAQLASEECSGAGQEEDFIIIGCLRTLATEGKLSDLIRLLAMCRDNYYPIHPCTVQMIECAVTSGMYDDLRPFISARAFTEDMKRAVGARPLTGFYERLANAFDADFAREVALGGDNMLWRLADAFEFDDEKVRLVATMIENEELTDTQHQAAWEYFRAGRNAEFAKDLAPIHVPDRKSQMIMDARRRMNAWI